MTQFKTHTLAIAYAAAFFLSCSGDGGDNGGNSLPSNSKTECVLNLLADDSQTPANIMAACEATESEVLAYLPENIGECKTADIDIGKTLGVIAEECGVGQIPIQISSSSNKQQNSSSSSGNSDDSSSSEGSSSSMGSSSSRSSSSSSDAYVPQFGTLTDDRDGKAYMTTTIGTQTWMAEDLDFHFSYFFGQYDWATAMNGEESSVVNPSGVRGICPSGWHIPSNVEWVVLLNAVGGASTAGTKLKAASGWAWNHFDDISGNGTDDYGFSALPKDSYGYEGCWITSTEGNDADNASYRFMEYGESEVSRLVIPKTTYCSLRCIQN